MERTKTNSESPSEFTFDRKKMIANLMELIPKMKELREKVKDIIPTIPDPKLKITAPESNTIQRDLEKICSVPHRRIGTKEAHEIEDFLEKTYRELGLIKVQKETFEVINWVATDWRLSIKTEKETIDIPSFYVLNTEFTDKKGISAPIIYVGAGSKKDFRQKDVAGKIVVADIEFPTLPLGTLLKMAEPYYVADPKHSFDDTTEIILTFALTNFPPQALGGKPREDSVYWRAVRGGALGLILILRDEPTNINSHWGPYDGSFKPVPALYVGKYDGMKVRELAQTENAEATLILNGYKEPSNANNIIGILPGQSEEMIMVSSHHDSAFQGASEDGAGVAMVLAQARAWSKIPKEKRAKSLLFVLTAGHLYGGIGAELFARKYRDNLLKNVAVDINLEHMCAKDVIEDPETHNYRFTNQLAMGAMFLTHNETLVAHTIKAFEDNKIERMILIPENYFATPAIGEAGHFTSYSDLKIIHWIRSPYYLLTAEDTLDKIDMEKLHPTAQCVTDLINSLMQLPPKF
jgi:hypothetical protein